MSDPHPSLLRSVARRAARRLVRLVTGPPPRTRETDPRALKGGLASRVAGEAFDATVPKNASGNNASVR